MRFLDLCKTLRQEAGIAGIGPSSVELQTGAYKKVVDWIARAYEEVQTQRKDWGFLWQETTGQMVVNQRDYTPLQLGMANFNEISREKGALRVIDPNGYQSPIHFIEYPEFRARFNSQVQPSRPQYLTLLPNKKIRFNCKPDQVYTLASEFYRTPFVMESNIDVPVFEEQCHMILVYKGLMYYSANEEAGFIYQDAQENYRRLLNRLEDLSLIQTFDMPPPLA